MKNVPAPTTKAKAPTKAQLAKTAANLAAAMKTERLEEHNITEEQRHADRRADDQIKSDAIMQFALQQLSTPAVTTQTPPQLTTPKMATAEFEAELAALQAKHGIVAAPTPAPKVVVVKIVKNGITRPATTNKCGKIWDTADAISAQIHGIASFALLKSHPALTAFNMHTLKTQYARWRAFNGVHGRLPTIATVHQTVGEYAGLPVL